MVNDSFAHHLWSINTHIQAAVYIPQYKKEQYVNDKANERQLNIIFMFIIGAFILILLTFAYLTTTLTLRYQESETRMVSMELSYLLNDEVNKLSSTDDRDSLLNQFFSEQTAFYKQEGISIWLTDSVGNTISGFTEKKELPETYLEAVKKTDDNICELYTGGHSLFIADRTIVIMQRFDDGRYCLIVENDGSRERQLQRMQYVLFFSIGTILIIVLIVLISNMISRYKVKIIKLATMDELTGLANRKSFTAEFNRMVSMIPENDTSFTMFLLDIDFFKQVNDQAGHAAGDAALVILADHIRNMLNKTGGLAGRWGGDEFIGVIKLPVEEAKERLLELCNDIEKDSKIVKPAFTISVGIAPVKAGVPLRELSEEADIALYASKHNGRNTVSEFSENTEIAETHTSEAQDEVSSDQSDNEEGLSFDMQSFKLSKSAETEHSLISMLKKRFLTSIVFAVKWMTPFVAAGGILIASAFLFDAASIDLSELSAEERSSLGSITSLATYLKFLGDTTINFMLPVFSAFMAYSLAGESAFMAGLVGGYMVIDTNSGFIGATLAGLAAGIISREISLFTERLPKFIRGAAPIIIYPVFSLTVVQAISFFMINPVTALLGSMFNNILNNAKNTGTPLVCTLAAGMMSVDMGGIINKIAYNYGVQSISNQETMIMAAVMAGGMVPPIGIAISTMLFKEKYSTDEHNNSIMALFMGLSFITEGALPYVITDITRVIPSCIAGSAIAGLLSSIFKCSLPAPHGGIFVLPVIVHPFMYGISILTGSIVTAVILGLLKKKRI